MISSNFKRFTVKSLECDSSRGVQRVALDNGQILELSKCWFDSLIEVGDCVGVCKTNDEDLTVNGVISIDDSNGCLVVDPDYLITSTDLSATYFCERKVWLNSRFKPGLVNEAFLIGDLVHCMFQQTINDPNITRIHLYTNLKSLIKQPAVLKTLLQLNTDEENVLNKAKDYIDSTIAFRQKYNSNIASGFDKSKPHLKLKVNKVTDIEDTVIAPVIGLKGKFHFVVVVYNLYNNCG